LLHCGDSVNDMTSETDENGPEPTLAGRSGAAVRLPQNSHSRTAQHFFG